ncbi:MAG: ribbon-helix-helix domain-containing protein [Candidatus Bathyarchaeia archaeon]
MSDKHLYVDCHELYMTHNHKRRKSMSDGNKRERITIRLTKRYLDLLNTLIDKGVYNSRNEAIRDALRIMYEYHGLKVAPEKKSTLKADDTSKS